MVEKLNGLERKHWDRGVGPPLWVLELKRVIEKVDEVIEEIENLRTPCANGHDWPWEHETPPVCKRCGEARRYL
jgi:hypothetical protein